MKLLLAILLVFNLIQISAINAQELNEKFVFLYLFILFTF